MPNPLFGISAACRLDVTAGSTSRAAYLALVAQYQFGTPVIHGRAPAELATAIGVPLYSGVGDLGLAATVPGVVVVSFPYATPTVAGTGFSRTVSTSVPSGTLVGVNYTDPNGVLWPDVDWEWQISVDGYLNTATGDAGKYQQQVVIYTGDGTAGRVIPTTFPLDSGKVAIWICGSVGALENNDLNCFRHNDAAMLGTSIMGSSTLQIAAGIMAFGAAGFTVTAGTAGAGNNFANGSGIRYTAIVLRDTTTDNRYLQIGSYGGTGDFSKGCTVAFNSTVVTSTGFLPAHDGLVCSDASGSYIFHYISSTAGTLGPAYRGTGPSTTLNFIGSPKTLTVAGLPVALTHLWIWGRGVQYRSTDFTGDASVGLAREAYPVVGAIQNLVARTFTIGAEVNVNSDGLTYYYAGLSLDAPLIAQNLFKSFKATGTATPPVAVTGLGFTPAVAFGRQYSAVATTGGVWRGPDHTGTDSTFCSFASNPPDLPTTGISAMAAGTVSLNTEIAPNGVDGYGWAFAGAGALTVPAPPVFVPAPPPGPSGPSPGVPPNPGVPPTGGGIPPGVLDKDPGGGQACRIVM